MRIKNIYDYRHEGHSRSPGSYVLVYDDPNSDVPITYTAKQARKLGERLIAEARNAERLKRTKNV